MKNASMNPIKFLTIISGSGAFIIGIGAFSLYITEKPVLALIWGVFSMIWFGCTVFNFIMMRRTRNLEIVRFVGMGARQPDSADME